MFNKRFLLLMGLIFLFVVMQPISALTASSDNYSVARFGTGVQATNLSSADLTGRAVLLANAGTRNAENDIHTANIGFWANTSYHVTVSIASWSISHTSAVQGSIIGLSISALNSKSVWVVLTLPNTTQETISLVNKGPVYAYTANAIGKYTVTFYANSSSGSLASVNLIDIFEITSSVIPPVTPPSVGGGQTVTKGCTYIWDCASWSICSEGKQQRECKNIGNCTGTEGKPIETRACSDALFDVVIKFKEVGLTQDKTLRFSVDLTEKTGIERLDIQVKYSIIDSNNTEIFSQIETRAIKGNLTYEKEINEIKLSDGDYVLRVDILYGNLQRAFAEQNFKVRGQEIEIIQPVSNIQKIIQFLKANYLIIIVIILLIIIIRKRKLKGIKEAKPRYLGNVKLIGGVKYLEIKPKPITNIRDKQDMSLEIPPSKENLLLKLKEFLSRLLKKHKKYPANSILGLINKKVYSDTGNYLGKIKDIILGKDKIEALKIKVDRKYKLDKEGVIINYQLVKSVGEVIIINGVITEHLKKRGKNV